jgi:twitching motility protein PilI
MAASPPLLSPTAALALGGFATAEPAPAVAAARDGPVTRHGVQVAGLGLLVPAGLRCRVHPLPALQSLPRARPHVLGVANVDGVVVPALDPARFLGLARPEARPMLLVFGAGREAAGFVVDGAPVTVRLVAADRIDGLPPVPERFAPHLRAAYAKDDALWFEFDRQGLVEAMVKDAV